MGDQQNDHVSSGAAEGQLQASEHERTKDGVERADADERHALVVAQSKKSRKATASLVRGSLFDVFSRVERHLCLSPNKVRETHRRPEQS
jgi:hypothetical protein